MTDPDARWSTASGRVDLDAGEVHVWRFALDPPDPVLARLDPTLDAAERQRAARFRTETLRRRFIAGRGGLRAVLSAYLDCPAARVAFAYGVHGKPRLADALAVGIEFNLAHSHGQALCGVTTGRALGVDLEAIRPLENSGPILQRFFSATEQAEFLAVPDAERLTAFYRGWSRKEAFLKAIGTGLATRLDSFDVTLGASARLLRVGDDPAEAPRWTLLDLDAGPGFAAALAALGTVSRLRFWDGPPALDNRPGARRSDFDANGGNRL